MLQLLLLSEGTRFLPSPPYRLFRSLSNHHLRQEQIQAPLPEWYWLHLHSHLPVHARLSNCLLYLDLQVPALKNNLPTDCLQMMHLMNVSHFLYAFRQTQLSFLLSFSPLAHVPTACQADNVQRWLILHLLLSEAPALLSSLPVSHQAHARREHHYSLSGVHLLKK